MSKKYKLLSQGNYKAFTEGVIYDECAKSSAEPEALSVAFFVNKYPDQWEEVVEEECHGYKVGDKVKLMYNNHGWKDGDIDEVVSIKGKIGFRIRLKINGEVSTNHFTKVDDTSFKEGDKAKMLNDYIDMFHKDETVLIGNQNKVEVGHTRISQIPAGWGNIVVPTNLLVAFDYTCPHSGESFMKEDAHYVDYARKFSDSPCFKVAGIVTEFKDYFAYSHTKEGILKWRNTVSGTNQYTTLTFWMKNEGAAKETTTLFGSEKPPVRLTPKRFYQEARYDEVFSAIARYFNAGLPVPKEWVEEFNELGDVINRYNEVKHPRS